MKSPQPARKELIADVIEVNGTALYYELRGDGPPVMFISGATGDAGHYEKVAGLLEDRFTVLTYDRRGNSRSPRPNGWDKTSMDEQTDDAVALLHTLDLAPAAVFGSSGGAIIALNLAIRYPSALRGAVLHEPPLMRALVNANEVLEQIASVTEQGRSAGGSRGAVEAFLRLVVGDANFESLSPQLRERVLGNGDTLFELEFGAFVDYLPHAATLASLKPPLQIMAGAESAPFFREAAQWLADRLNSQLIVVPGAHTPYHDRPRELVAAIRPFLQQVS